MFYAKTIKKYVTHNFNYSTDMNYHNCNDFSENIILFNVFNFFSIKVTLFQVNNIYRRVFQRFNKKK